jgi:hypothetical protein
MQSFSEVPVRTKPLWAKVQAAALLLLLFVLLIILLPFVVNWYARQARLDWVTLSNVGQAYGFSATIISALALLAIAISLRMQVHESRAQRRENHRSSHVQLLTLALKDPDLIDCVPAEYGDGRDKKKLYYMNLLFWWWNYNYRAGLVSEFSLRKNVSYYAGQELGRYYLDAAAKWRDPNPDSIDRQFFGIVDDERSSSNGVETPPRSDGQDER